MTMNRDAELVEIRRMILSLGATVEARLRCICQAVTDLDLEAANLVRHGDREIDEKEVEIEQACLRVLALSHPVAGDLRFLLAVLRINGDLERIGDLVKGIAKRILDLERAPSVELPDALPQMATYARDMVDDALSALADEDADRCHHIRRADKRLDDLQKEVIVWVHQSIPEQVETTQGAIDALSMARAFERIGDLATNIAEDVIFLVRGAIVRHTSTSMRSSDTGA